MRRTVVIAPLAALAVAGCQNLSASAQEPKPKPWTPPATKLPADFVKAVVFLHEHGLGDPRGGEPVQATVPSAEAWSGGGQPLPLKGWLLRKEGKFVGVDGLVYKASEANRELKKEDLLLIGSGEETKSFRSPFRTGDLLLPALLLLRGEVAEAEKAYKPGFPGGPTSPFLSLANAYLTARFQRGVAAHMRGDDELAYSDAAALQRDQAAYEAMGQQAWASEAHYRHDEKTPAFPFLEPVGLLAEDSKRRLDHPRNAKPDLAAIAKLPQNERIKALIDALDEANARQMSQPGGVDLAADPIVDALAKEGPAAGDPLLDTIEHDRRLTRSVSFARDFFPARNLISVRDAAMTAFRQVVQFDQITPYGQSVSVAALRAFWNETKRMTPPERWMKVLETDGMEPRQWMEAAQRLVDPATTERHGAWITITRKSDGSAPMKGEPVRERQSPSVSELLAKRALEVATLNGENNSNQGFQLSNAIDLGLDLAKWDLTRAVPTLRDLSGRVFDALGKTDRQYIVPIAARNVVRLTETRVRLGDTAALAQYASWLGEVRPEGSRELSVLFYPLVKHRDEPSMRAAAQTLLTGKGSPWNLSESIEHASGAADVEWFIGSPIVTLPEARSALLTMLKDDQVIGSAVHNGRSTQVQTSHGTMSYTADDVAPKVPSGTRREVRVADWIAFRLRPIKGSPKFEPTWPKADRDRAIAQLAAKIKSGELRPGENWDWAHLDS